MEMNGQHDVTAALTPCDRTPETIKQEPGGDLDGFDKKTSLLPLLGFENRTIQLVAIRCISDKVSVPISRPGLSWGGGYWTDIDRLVLRTRAKE